MFNNFLKIYKMCDLKLLDLTKLVTHILTLHLFKERKELKNEVHFLVHRRLNL